MAEITDDAVVNSEVETASEIKDQSAASTEPAQAPAAPAEPPIPKKYQGKSVNELIDELETTKRSMGKYANELGEVRRLADELIKSQLKPEKKEEPIKEIDFFENPQEAIRKQIESNPEVQAAKQFAVQAKQAQAKAEFERKHPDYQGIIQDKDFGEWVMGSKVRQKLWKEAVDYDVDSADELFSTYKQLKGINARQQQTTEVDPVEQASRDAALKSASVDAGGTGESTRKIWSRSKIMHMRLYEKAKFEANREEIERAYAEGRVKS